MLEPRFIHDWFVRPATIDFVFTPHASSLHYTGEVMEIKYQASNGVRYVGPWQLCASSISVKQRITNMCTLSLSLINQVHIPLSLSNHVHTPLVANPVCFLALYPRYVHIGLFYEDPNNARSILYVTWIKTYLKHTLPSVHFY